MDVGIVLSLSKGERMKTFGRILFILAIGVLTACGPKAGAEIVVQVDNPYAPQSGDGDLIYGDITVDSSSVFLVASQPPQMMVNFSYFQPTPCHQLRVEVSKPDDKNQIYLKAYAIVEKDRPCALMALATPLPASLTLGSLPGGHYIVFLNDNQIGEFDL
jgi:hypothetical protein